MASAAQTEKPQSTKVTVGLVRELEAQLVKLRKTQALEYWGYTRELREKRPTAALEEVQDIHIKAREQQAWFDDECAILDEKIRLARADVIARSAPGYNYDAGSGCTGLSDFYVFHNADRLFARYALRNEVPGMREALKTFVLRADAVPAPTESKDAVHMPSPIAKRAEAKAVEAQPTPANIAAVVAQQETQPAKVEEPDERERMRKKLLELLEKKKV